MGWGAVEFVSRVHVWDHDSIVLVVGPRRLKDLTGELKSAVRGFGFLAKVVFFTAGLLPRSQLYRALKQVKLMRIRIFIYLPPKAGFNWRGPARR